MTAVELKSWLISKGFLVASVKTYMGNLADDNGQFPANKLFYGLVRVQGLEVSGTAVLSHVNADGSNKNLDISILPHTAESHFSVSFNHVAVSDCDAYFEGYEITFK
jgi:hypothetical protein